MFLPTQPDASLARSAFLAPQRGHREKRQGAQRNDRLRLSWEQNGFRLHERLDRPFPPLTWVLILDLPTPSAPAQGSRYMLKTQYVS